MSSVLDRFSLKGKVALVTGGAGILGTRFSETLLSAGATVAVVDLPGPALQSMNNKLKGKGEFAIFECDLSSEDSVKKTVSGVLQKWGHIDILLNNAASKSSSLDRFFDPFEDFTLKTWQEVMSVNVDGVFLMAKYVGRHMRESKIKGSVINIASIYGVVAPDQRIYEGSEYMGRPINTPAVYSASKAAVVGLTQYLSTYWGEHGIRVNTLTPGGVESGQNETFKKRYEARVPLGRMADAQDLQGALLFLASEASNYVTGQNLIVDGGLTVW